MSSALDWNAVATLLAVVRTGSLSAAARELGLAQPTVRRLVAGLEAALGEALFTRSPAGLAPTERALALVPFAEDAAATFQAMARMASGGANRVSGVVRVTASRMVGVEVLPPMLAGLRLEHPDLRIELSPTDGQEDLLRREADIAVRMVRPVQAAVVARLVGRIGLGLFAAESYAARRGVPQAAAELGRHDLVLDDRRGRVAEALAGFGIAVARERVAFSSDDDLAQLAALRAGLGIGVAHKSLAARYRLVPVLPAMPVELECWLAMHEDLSRSPRVRAACERLGQTLGDYCRGKLP